MLEIIQFCGFQLNASIFLLKVVYTVFLSFLWELKKYVVGDCQRKYNNYYYANVNILLIHTFSTPTSDN